ncbi:MAG: DUF5711 family protein [Bariatricus sp.]
MGVIVELRDPMGDLQEKIKIHKRRIRRKGILTILTILAAIISTFLLIEVQTYNQTRVMQEYGSGGNDGGSYMQYSTGVLKYSRDGIAFLNKKGEEQWNQPYQIKNPLVHVSGDSAAAADRGGNDIFVFDKKGLRGEIHTNFPIEQFAISENGIVSVLLKNESTPQVVCYDAAGNVLVEHRTSLSGQGYPIGMALSPNGTMLQISYLCVVDGVEATRVAYYDFANSDKEDSSPVTEEVYKNQVIPVSYFANNKVSVLVGDSAFLLYKGADQPALSKTVEIEKEIKSVFYDKEYIGFVLQNVGTEGYELRLYNMSGNLALSREFEGEYSNIKVSNGNVIMYDGKKCLIYSELGVKKFEGEMDKDIMEILPLQGINKYLVMNADGMEEIRLVK